VEVIPEHMRSLPQPQNKGPMKDAMTPDKEPSVAKNLLAKSTRLARDNTLVVTSSPVPSATQIFRYGCGLAHRPKMLRSHRENKSVVISYFIFRPSSTICIFNFYLSPFHPPYFHLLLLHSMFLFPSLHAIKSKISKIK
jgi:hypothetical protein